MLAKGQFLKSVWIPAPKAGQKAAYVKLKERGTWDFALVSAAVAGVVKDGALAEIIVVMGGVAPVPWRLKKAEDVLRGKPVTEALIRQAADAALEGRGALAGERLQDRPRLGRAQAGGHGRRRMTYSSPKLLETLAAGRRAEQRLVLATIVETRRIDAAGRGGSAIFSSAGLVMGTVGGGLLEARVESIAGEALRDGKARLVSIQLDADPSDTEGAICGGAARVLIDPGCRRIGPSSQRPSKGSGSAGPAT